MSEIFNAPTLKSDPYLRKLRRRGVITVFLAIIAVLILSVMAISLFISLPNIKESPKVVQEKVLDLWNEKDYAGVAAVSDTSLENSPLDPFFLLFKGFSNFYLGLAESDGERRMALMQSAIFSIRKVLLNPGSPLKPEAEYVLGKAYFYKGRDYYDDAMVYLSNAIEAGYVANDAWEYLALSAQGLGLIPDCLLYFDRAVVANPDSPELLVAAANANLLAGNTDRVEQLALKALDMTADEYLAERCYFILGDSYRLQKRFEDALSHFELIKQLNPQSADAWYYEGLTQMDAGDPLRARAAWRKAVSIDPMHIEARLKLSERS